MHYFLRCREAEIWNISSQRTVESRRSLLESIYNLLCERRHKSPNSASLAANTKRPLYRSSSAGGAAAALPATRSVCRPTWLHFGTTAGNGNMLAIFIHVSASTHFVTHTHAHTHARGRTHAHTHTHTKQIFCSFSMVSTPVSDCKGPRGSCC